MRFAGRSGSNHFPSPRAVPLLLGCALLACGGADDAQVDADEGALEAGGTVESYAFVRSRNVSPSEDAPDPELHRKLCPPGEAVCPLYGLLISQEHDRALAKTVFTGRYNAPLPMLDQGAMVAPSAVRKTPPYSDPLAMTLLGKKIYHGDWVRIRYGKLLAGRPYGQGNFGDASVAYWMDDVTSVDVTYARPRLQCVSAPQANGRNYVLVTESGRAPLTYGPGTRLKLHSCSATPGELCSVEATAELNVTEANKSPLSFVGHHERWALSGPENELRAAFGERYWSMRPVAIREKDRLGMEDGRNNRVRDVDLSARAELDFNMQIGSPLALSGLPLATHLSVEPKDRAAVRADAERVPNAELQWTCGLRATDVVMEKRVPMFCSRFE